jgi:hypothetical protein
MYIGAKSHVCRVSLVFVLTHADGLCCLWFIYPVLCWCPEIGTSSIDRAQLSRLLPEDGDRIQSPKLCF